LDARIGFEDKARREFGKAIQELEEQRKIVKELNHQLVQLINDIAVRRKKILTVQHFIQDIHFEGLLRRKIKAQKAAISAAIDRVEEKRVQMIKARKDRKILEKLKNRKLDEFRKLLNKEEFKFADEVARRKIFTKEPLFNGE